MLLNTHTILQAKTLTYSPRTQFHRYSSKHAHKSTVIHYKLLNTTTIPPTITTYWTHTQFHWQSIRTTEHCHTFTVNHYILLNTHTISSKYIIDSWTRTQLQRQSLYTTEHAHNYNNIHSKLINTTAIPKAITLNY